MNTPAGWYDDGSGRQRWWDGEQWTDQYATPATDAAGADDSAGGAYPGATPQPTAVATKPSIIGLIALGAAALGTILACIPATIIIGWILLPIAFVLSIVAFFIKGKKWAPIAAVSLSVVGTIIAIVVAIVLASLALTAYTEELGGSSSSPSPTEDDSAVDEDDSSVEEDTPDEDTTDDDTALFRPSAEEVAAGLGEVLAATGFESYTEEQLVCFGDALVTSDMSDESLQSLAAGQDALASAADATILTESLAAAAPVCMAP